MKISNQGIINRGQPNTPRAFSTFPALTPLADGSLLSTYRVGSSKEFSGWHNRTEALGTMAGSLGATPQPLLPRP